MHDEEAEEIPGVPIAEENAGVPAVGQILDEEADEISGVAFDEEAEEIAGVPLIDENVGVPPAEIEGVPHTDEAEEMDAKYGARTGR